MALLVALVLAVGSTAVAQQQPPENEIATLNAAPMPNVRKLSGDAARARVAAVGIYGDFEIVFTPTLPADAAKELGAVDVGAVIDQDPPAGDEVESGVGDLEPIQLTVYTGPYTPGRIDDPRTCRQAARDLADELPKVDADIAGGIVRKIGIDASRSFRLLGNRPAGFVPEVARVARLPGRRCAAGVDVDLPSDRRSQDLQLILAPRSRRLTFDDDWALTAGQPSFFTIQVVDRALHVLHGAQVELDISDLGGKDVRGTTSATGKTSIKATPKKAGIFDLVASVTAGNGRTLYGVSRVRVKDRSAASRLETFLGDRFRRPAGGGPFRFQFRGSRARAAGAIDDSVKCAAYRATTGAGACGTGYRRNLGVLVLNPARPVSSDVGLIGTEQGGGIEVAAGDNSIRGATVPRARGATPVGGGALDPFLKLNAWVGMRALKLDDAIGTGEAFHKWQDAFYKGESPFNKARGDFLLKNPVFLKQGLALAHVIKLTPTSDFLKMQSGPPAFDSKLAFLKVDSFLKADYGDAVLSKFAPTRLGFMKFDYKF